MSRCSLSFTGRRATSAISRPGTACGSRCSQRGRHERSSPRPRAPALMPPFPHLRDYFRVLAHGVKGPVDIEQAARTELDWWQARREAVKPEQYGQLIARVSTLLYGIDNEDLRKSGVLRAQAMEYRDARNNKMTEA